MIILASTVAGSLAIGLIAGANDEPSKKAEDPDLVADLKLIQGSWELQHGNEGKGRPTTRSVKTIEGNVETLRRYNAKTGKKTHEHSVEIKLSKSGEVRVCTFYAVGGSPENGLSFVYKVDAENYYDIPGLLQGREYRNYQQTPKIWHWKRIIEKEAVEPKPAPNTN
jgi:hypothetical protein